VAGGAADDLAQGMLLAQKAIDNGKAAGALEKLVALTNA
jgi:anthranilate phosphoribosyltransferase